MFFLIEKKWYGQKKPFLLINSFSKDLKKVTSFSSQSKTIIFLCYCLFVNVCQKVQLKLNKFRFLKILKIHENLFVKIRELFLFSFTMYTKRTCSQLIQKMGAKLPIRLVYIYLACLFECLFITDKCQNAGTDRAHFFLDLI